MNDLIDYIIPKCINCGATVNKKNLHRIVAKETICEWMCMSCLKEYRPAEYIDLLENYIKNLKKEK